MSWLETGASIAEIGTAVVAVVGAAWYTTNLARKRTILENYLEEQKAKKPLGPTDHGRRTLMHLVAHLKMSQEEVSQAAFRSKKIDPKPSVDSNQRTTTGRML